MNNQLACIKALIHDNGVMEVKLLAMCSSLHAWFCRKHLGSTRDR